MIVHVYHVIHKVYIVYGLNLLINFINLFCTDSQPKSPAEFGFVCAENGVLKEQQSVNDSIDAPGCDSSELVCQNPEVVYVKEEPQEVSVLIYFLVSRIYW